MLSVANLVLLVKAVRRVMLLMVWPRRMFRLCLVRMQHSLLVLARMVPLEHPDLVQPVWAVLVRMLLQLTVFLGQLVQVYLPQDEMVLLGQVMPYIGIVQWQELAQMARLCLVQVEQVRLVPMVWAQRRMVCLQPMV